MENKILSSLRKNKGYTQKYMAEKLGISTVSYHLYEAGKRKIPKSKTEDICAILGVNIEDIFLPSSFSLR